MPFVNAISRFKQKNRRNYSLLRFLSLCDFFSLRLKSQFFQKGVFAFVSERGGGYFTVLKQINSGNGVNVELLGKSIFFVDVYCAHFNFAVELLGKFVSHGRPNGAWNAPARPDNDDDGKRGV